MKKVEIIKYCPSCNSILYREKDQLFCLYPECKDKTKQKILKFAKTLKIKGLGEKTIEKLNITSISSIYFLTRKDIVDTLGEKVGDKLYKEIEHSKKQPLGIFLAALSIPSIGRVTAERLEGKISSIEDITEEICTAAGLGPVVTRNLLSFLEENDWINKLPITIDFGKTRPKTKINVVITGKLKDYPSRDKAKQYLATLGVDVKSSVSKKINYVICDVEGSNSSSIKKAKQYNIKIVTMKQFKEIINGKAKVD